MGIDYTAEQAKAVFSLMQHGIEGLPAAILAKHRYNQDAGEAFRKMKEMFQGDAPGEIQAIKDTLLALRINRGQDAAIALHEFDLLYNELIKKNRSLTLI